jgi:hypothetical protein
MDSRNIRISFYIVWAISSSIIFAILVSPHVITQEKLSKYVPKCEWKIKYNKECILCGMTRSFLLIAKHNYREALLYNRGSITLYYAFLLNEIFFIISIIGLASKRVRLFFM